MSFMGSLLGFGDNKGLDFQAQQAQIDKAVTQQQAQQTGAQAQGGIDQQQAFVNALAAQGGLGNQSQVFQQQQALANQLGQMAQGQGPNPAQAALAQATANNVAQQNALMAGQRGAAANPGLLARQAAMQGANTQQQAVGQSATLQAQQQIAAANALQQQQASMANLANQQVGQQVQGLQNLNQASQNLYGQQLGAIGNQNSAAISNAAQANNANAGIQGNLANKQGDFGYALINSAGGAILGAAMNKGGRVQHMADGGEVMPEAPVDGPRSRAGGFISQMLGFSAPAQVAPAAIGSAPQAPAAAQSNPAADAGKTIGGGIGKMLTGGMGGGGMPSGIPMAGEAGMPAAGAAGGIDPMMLMKLAPMAAGMPPMLANKGAMVPGKPSVRGDSLKNDKVPAVLSPGEIVLPRSVVNAKDPAEAAAKFVRAVLAKENMKSKGKQ